MTIISRAIFLLFLVWSWKWQINIKSHQFTLEFSSATSTMDCSSRVMQVPPENFYYCRGKRPLFWRNIVYASFNTACYYDLIQPVYVFNCVLHVKKGKDSLNWRRDLHGFNTQNRDRIPTPYGRRSRTVNTFPNLTIKFCNSII